MGKIPTTRGDVDDVKDDGEEGGVNDDDVRELRNEIDGFLADPFNADIVANGGNFKENINNSESGSSIGLKNLDLDSDPEAENEFDLGKSLPENLVVGDGDDNVN